MTLQTYFIKVLYEKTHSLNKSTTSKVSKYGVFSETGKYGPKKTSYLNTFHTVKF